MAPLLVCDLRLFRLLNRSFIVHIKQYDTTIRLNNIAKSLQINDPTTHVLQPIDLTLKFIKLVGSYSARNVTHLFVTFSGII